MKLNPGYKRTEVGIMPEDWQLTLLDHVAKRGSGHTPDKKHPEYWNGNIKWISLADSPALDRMFIDDTFAKVTPQGIAHSSAVVHPAGTVVLSRDAGVGKSAIMRTEMAVSQHFMAWVCGPELDNRFLYYWLQRNKPEFERIANGTTIKTIGLHYFRNLKIPKPPLPEQRVIASALSDMDTLLDGLDCIIAKKRDLRQATMQQILTGKTRLPGYTSEWVEKPLWRVSQLSRTGVSPSATPDAQFLHFSLPAFDANREPVVESGASIGSNKFVVPEHAVLLSKLNPRIPRIWAPEIIPPNSVCSTEFLVLEPKSDLDRNFLKYALLSPGFCAQMELHAVGTTGSHQRIQPDEAMEINIKAPVDRGEQVAIVTVLSDIDVELATLEQRLAKTRDLKQAMMQELLTGKTRLVAVEFDHA